MTDDNSLRWKKEEQKKPEIQEITIYTTGFYDEDTRRPEPIKIIGIPLGHTNPNGIEDKQWLFFKITEEEHAQFNIDHIRFIKTKKTKQLKGRDWIK